MEKSLHLVRFRRADKEQQYVQNVESDRRNSRSKTFKSKTRNNQLDQACLNGLDTSKSVRGLRFEPENGSDLDSDFYGTLDECDSILKCGSRLFSDGEDEDNEEIDEQIKSELDTLHSRSKDIFTVAQMIQSTTQLRFTVIQAELKNVACAVRKVRQLRCKLV